MSKHQSLFDIVAMLVLSVGILLSYSVYVRMSGQETEAHIKGIENDVVVVREGIADAFERYRTILNLFRSDLLRSEDRDNERLNDLVNTLKDTNSSGLRAIASIDFFRHVGSTNLQNNCDYSYSESRDVHGRFSYSYGDLCAQLHALDAIGYQNFLRSYALLIAANQSVNLPVKPALYAAYMHIVVPVGKKIHSGEKAAPKGWIGAHIDIRKLADKIRMLSINPSAQISVFDVTDLTASPLHLLEIGRNDMMPVQNVTLKDLLLFNANTKQSEVSVSPKNNASRVAKRMDSSQINTAVEYKILSLTPGQVIYRSRDDYYLESLMIAGNRKFLIRAIEPLNVSYYPALISALGVFITSVLSLVFFMQSRTRANAEKIAEDMSEEVRIREERLRAAADGSNDGLWDWHITNNTVWYSNRYIEMLGYIPEKFIHSFDQFQALVHPDDWHLVQVALSDHLRYRAPFDVLFRMRHAQGHYLWIRSRGRAVFERGEAVRMAGVHTDVTTEKEREAQLAKARAAAEDAAQAKTDFLANMSHEIRTPLNGILGVADLLRTTDLTAKQYQYLNILQSSGQSLLTLVNDVLDFSKLEARQMKIEKISFNLMSMLAEIVDLCAAQIPASSQVELIFRYAPGLPNFFISDPTRLRQCVLNFLTNALKFTEKGYVLLNVDGVPVGGKKYALSLRVDDTGIGIAEDKRQDILTKFTQADNSTTRKYGGTGLGLAIVNELVPMLGGELKIESSLGEGSSFIIDITLEESEQSRIVCYEQSVAGMRLAILDDNATNRTIFSEMLEYHSAEVEQCANPTDFIDLLLSAKRQGKPFDIALMDYHMPSMSGDEVGMQIKAHPELASTHMVLVTSHGRKGDGLRMKEIGFSGYLLKPIIPSNLLFALSSIRRLAETGETDIFVTRHTLTESRIETLSAERKATIEESHGNNGKRILIAEDNLTNQQVISWVLEGLGYSFAIVNHGEEALQLLQKDHDFDAILMDCQMPVMDGYEATQRIRNSGRGYAKIPIIALTANTMEEDVKRCFSVGMNHYLAKPLSSEKLQEALHMLSGKLSQKSDASPENKTVSSMIVDAEKLKQLIAGDAIRAEKLWELFDRTYEEQIAKVRSALEKQSMDEVAKALHALKGACANLYALEMQKCVVEMEQAAKANNSELLNQKWPDLAAAFTSYRQAYTQFTTTL
jgi:PAS domain S-box-containing protein